MVQPSGGQVRGQWHVISPAAMAGCTLSRPRPASWYGNSTAIPRRRSYSPAQRHRSYIVATPVVWENKLYVASGRQPDDNNGEGHLWCIDITKTPQNKDKDVSPIGDNFDPKAADNKDSGLVWHYGGPVVPKPEGEAANSFSAAALAPWPFTMVCSTPPR